MTIMRIQAKCSDLFTASIDGKTYDGYVPPGLGVGRDDGDYIDLEIDIDTGQIIGWKRPSDTLLAELGLTNSIRGNGK